ncbi:MAG: hypothetical protein PHE51_01805 [Eubacteriales bacterium]|nr:hypothetical protein [Eubacteriales bacterium]
MSIIKSRLGGKLLTPEKDEVTGVISYKLFNPQNRIQQNFYFTSISMSLDDRFLVYLSSTPEDKKQNLWITDFEKEEVRPLITRGFDVESCVLDEKRGKIWYARDGVCYGVNIEDTTPDREEYLFEFPQEIAKGQTVKSFSNHLSLNGKNNRIAYSGGVGKYWYVGYYDLDEKSHNIIHKSIPKATHVQYAPDMSDRILFCHDWWTSEETGEKHSWDHRLWMYDPSKSEPVFPIYFHEHEMGVEHTPFHEYWQKDGSCIYLCDIPHGVMRHDPQTPDKWECVWSGRHAHCHSDGTGTRFVSDINTYAWVDGVTSSLAYFNKATGKEGYISLTVPPATKFPNKDGRHYHSHPHPTFSPSDKWILYGNTKHSQMNLSIVDCDDIF